MFYLKRKSVKLCFLYDLRIRYYYLIFLELKYSAIALRKKTYVIAILLKNFIFTVIYLLIYLKIRKAKKKHCGFPVFIVIIIAIIIYNFFVRNKRKKLFNLYYKTGEKSL